MTTRRRALSARRADEDGQGAVIGGFAVGHAPVDVIVNSHFVAWAFMLISAAIALTAGRPATAIHVADQVILAVFAVVTGADPADLRDLCARRTLRSCPAAARAELAVHGAILPVVALAGIHLMRIRACPTEGAIDGEQWRERGADGEPTQEREHSPA